jgi:hypothetical protein
MVQFLMGVMRDFFFAFSGVLDKFPPWGLMPWCVWGWTLAVGNIRFYSSFGGIDVILITVMHFVK